MDTFEGNTNIHGENFTAARVISSRLSFPRPYTATVSELIRDQVVLISDRKEISSPVPGQNGVEQRNGLLCHDSIDPVTHHG
ncbi:hypothetical protein RRG08_018687 [Elysia crispata]|uniref:Uncharacterized protein n=1 Tax=Elysia crispata TaxID=231223 RepID=A0AAE1APV9_9GAST|nr:hypothetical protein RRG08_018687 [Elysia crispata]